MPADTPDLLKVFLTVHDNHNSGSVVYCLEGDAYTIYQETHDQLVTQKLKTNSENAQGILSKARGYCARIDMVIHALEQALQQLDRSDLDTSADDVQPDWECRVTPKAVKAAPEIISHFNQQKFIMLGLNLDTDSEEDNSGSSISLPKKIVRLLSTTWRSNDGCITPSEVCQKHISERVGHSYPSSKAVDLLVEVESLRYGEMQEITTSNRRKVSVLRKRHYETLSEVCLENLKRSKVTKETFKKSFETGTAAQVTYDEE